jgi:hypothetical protein
VRILAKPLLAMKRRIQCRPDGPPRKIEIQQEA